MLEKTTFIELQKITGRKVVLFGSGNIAKKTIRRLDKNRIDFIVDNSNNLQGTSYEGFNIFNPDQLNNSKHFIIICSTAISEITDQLEQSGFEKNHDFIISPILNDLLAISDLEELKTEFYITSGSIPIHDKLMGGGLYKCIVNGVETSLQKVYEGPCYGSIHKDGEIYFVDTDAGMMKLNIEGKIENLCEWPAESRAHGISFNESNGHFYVTCSYLDAVLEYDQNYRLKREFKLSDKLKIENEPVHHCNDNYSMDNSLYVSMFSSTGNWKKDVFDGCIAEFNIVTGERLNDICTDLYMPHNIKFYDGALHVLDSLPGHLRYNNFSIQGTFPAFTRGLNYYNGLYYIGQSKNRNYSKVLGLSKNISIDCGVIIFNPELKVSRFIQFPYKIGEIHSIVVTK